MAQTMARVSEEQEDPTTGPSRLRQREVLVAMMGQVFIIMLGIGIVGPVTPLYAQSFGVGAAMVGGLTTSFGIARIVMNIPAGTLTERIGRRPLLILGPLTTALAALLTGLASQFGQLILFRFLQGLGSAAQTTAAMTVMADITDREGRGRAMSFYQGSLLLGSGLGPTVGGLVAEHFGFRAPFFLYAALAAAAALWATLRVPETRGFQPAAASAGERRASTGAVDGGTHRAPMGRAVWEHVTDLNFLLISLVTLAIFFTRTGSRSTVLPLFGDNRLGLSPGQLGVTFTIIAAFNLVSINWSGLISDKYGRKAVIVPASVLSGLALLAFSLCRSYAGFLASGALLGVGTGMAGPAPAAYVADLARPGSYGLTMGIYRTFGDIGVSIGPVLLGAIADRFGFLPALWTNGLLFVIAGLAFGLFARETVTRPVPQVAGIGRRSGK
ncbi:MAG TPA: MFS transporter [Chloroflexi bacterium]|jgi:DHA1 family multidrug resistance protein-like MFS transporter|nr:MFS transporter [Chloroflexota bacterium]